MENGLVKRLNTEIVDKQSTELAQQIMEETDADKVKDFVNLFNLSTQKRNVARVLKMTDLLDKVTEQVLTRFEKTPDNFSNEDLLKFMQVTETSIEKAKNSLNQVSEIPAIQYQQNNQVNINIGEGLNRESRQKVTEAVQSILKKFSAEDISNITVPIENEGEIIEDVIEES